MSQTLSDLGRVLPHCRPTGSAAATESTNRDWDGVLGRRESGAGRVAEELTGSPREGCRWEGRGRIRGG